MTREELTDYENFRSKNAFRYLTNDELITEYLSVNYSSSGEGRTLGTNEGKEKDCRWLMCGLRNRFVFNCDGCKSQAID